MLLYCATANQHKLAEFRLAAGDDFAIEGLPAAPCPEDGATFEENATAKALCYARVAMAQGIGGHLFTVFADDSGLEVDALDGRPGIRSARFAGLNANDQANNDLLLEKLAGFPDTGRGARFVCAIALVRGSQCLATFSGMAQGRILHAPAGSGGFGYDPVFFYPPLNRTFAELSAEEKWRHSHRGQAFRQMIEWLRASGYFHRI